MIFKSFNLGVSKNRGKTPKMDGENNGKPYFLMDDLGGKTPLFLVQPTPMYNNNLFKSILEDSDSKLRGMITRPTSHNVPAIPHFVGLPTQAYNDSHLCKNMDPGERKIIEWRSLCVFFGICGCSLNFWFCKQAASHAETKLIKIAKPISLLVQSAFSANQFYVTCSPLQPCLQHLSRVFFYCSGVIHWHGGYAEGSAGLPFV